MNSKEIMTILESMLVVIRGMEFCKDGGTDATGWGVCPDCGSADWHGHTNACSLDRQIKEYEKTLPIIKSALEKKSNLKRN